MSRVCERIGKDHRKLTLSGLCHLVPRPAAQLSPISTGMPAPLTADDLLPLIAKLSTEERHRLLQLVFRQGRTDVEAYAAQPVQPDEFTSDVDALSWDADGWEGVG